MMNTFQTVAMTFGKIVCALLIYKEVCCADGQRQDTSGHLGHHKFYTDQNEVNQMISHVIFHHGQPQLVKRKLDRFRFFHKGLGKRSSETVFDDTDQINEGGDSSILVELQGLSNELNKFEKMIPSIQRYIFTKYPDFLSKEIKNFRNLQGTKNWQSKRAPEIFSEKLYPLQSGKQELEATLDQTLNSNEDDFNDNMEDFDQSSVKEASDIISNEVPNELHNDQIATKYPFDIYFASPDLEKDEETQIQDKIEDKRDTDANDGQRSKRWWAANMLSRFRSPKSWNRRVSNAIHADPAIYFLGLGR